jgi:signal peptidase I
VTQPADEPKREPPVDLSRVPKRKPMRWLGRILVAGAALGTAMGVVLALLFGSYKIPSGSMWPTLLLGDRVLAARIAKQPFRGMLMVFHYPEHREALFAKRVVALEGDTVGIDKGELVINGWHVPRCVLGRASYRDDSSGSGEKHEGTLAVEWLGVATYLVFDETTGLGAPGEGSSWKVAPGQYFVMGDNRNNSHDSRMWFGGQGGGVPLSDSIGGIVGHDTVTLPKGAEELEAALAACLSKRPEPTEPPAVR